MVTQRSRLKFTYEDYKQTPDDTRYELLDGELILLSTPWITHQRISRKIFTRLDSFITENDLGEVFHAPCDVVLSDFNVVQPDILFVSNERSHIMTDANVQGRTGLGDRSAVAIDGAARQDNQARFVRAARRTRILASR